MAVVDTTNRAMGAFKISDTNANMLCIIDETTSKNYVLSLDDGKLVFVNITDSSDKLTFSPDV